jgi:hypothetical protein
MGIAKRQSKEPLQEVWQQWGRVQKHASVFGAFPRLSRAFVPGQFACQECQKQTRGCHVSVETKEVAYEHQSIF